MTVETFNVSTIYPFIAWFTLQQLKRFTRIHPWRKRVNKIIALRNSARARARLRSRDAVRRGGKNCVVPQEEQGAPGPRLVRSLCPQYGAAGAYEISIFAPAKSGGAPFLGGMRRAMAKHLQFPRIRSGAASCRARTVRQAADGVQLYEIPCLARVSATRRM